MTANDFDWREALAQLFAATVNQQTLEEAVELMVSVSASDRGYHEECMHVLDSAIASAASGRDEVIAPINKSGYQVSDANAALELLQEFRALYVDEFSRTVG